MFSEELLELDRNTVELMIEDMRRQIEEKDEQRKIIRINYDEKV